MQTKKNQVTGVTVVQADDQQTAPCAEAIVLVTDFQALMTRLIFPLLFFP